MATMMVRNLGARLPGELHCDCGHVALAIWHAKHGTYCQHCGRGWFFDSNVTPPPPVDAGIYPLVPNPKPTRGLSDTGYFLGERAK